MFFSSCLGWARSKDIKGVLQSCAGPFCFPLVHLLSPAAYDSLRSMCEVDVAAMSFFHPIGYAWCKGAAARAGPGPMILSDELRPHSLVDLTPTRRKSRHRERMSRSRPVTAAVGDSVSLNCPRLSCSMHRTSDHCCMRSDSPRFEGRVETLQVASRPRSWLAESPSLPRVVTTH